MKHPLSPDLTVVAQLVPWLVPCISVGDTHPYIGYRRIPGRADFQETIVRIPCIVPLANLQTDLFRFRKSNGNIKTRFINSKVYRPATNFIVNLEIPNSAC